MDIALENNLIRKRFRTFNFAETLRIRFHLAKVEIKLRNKDVCKLSLELKERRIENLDRLHSYWVRGKFPKNPDFSHRIPYFKDASGVPCAVAYLIEKSGKSALVNEVARTNNHVYVNDIQDGPVLDWINNSGLTQDEAALIQPSYGPCWPDICPPFYNFVQNYFPIVVLLASVGITLLTKQFAKWRLPESSRIKKSVALIYFIIVGFNVTSALSQNIFFQVLPAIPLLSVLGILFLGSIWLSDKFAKWLFFESNRNKIVTALLYYFGTSLILAYFLIPIILMLLIYNFNSTFY